MEIVHTSGHASPADLRRLLTALAPRCYTPVHTQHPGGLRDHHSGRTVLQQDGAWWAVP